MPPIALATRVIDGLCSANHSAAPSAAPTPQAENVKRPCDGHGEYIASNVGCSSRRSARRIAVAAIGMTRRSGTNTSVTRLERLPVPRRPVGNQSSIVSASWLGTRNMCPSRPSPTGAWNTSHSEKSDPLQNPHWPVRR